MNCKLNHATGEGHDEECKANAALIVRAVNRDHLFGELVEALETTRREMKIAYTHVSPTMQPGIYDNLRSAIAQADTVLAKVEATDA